MQIGGKLTPSIIAPDQLRAQIIADIAKVLQRHGITANPTEYLSKSLVSLEVALDAIAKLRLQAHLETHYHTENWRPCWRCRECSIGNPSDCTDKTLAWEELHCNRVTTVGLNKLLDATFKTGLAAPLWYVGTVGAAISDAAITSGLAVLTSASNPFAASDATRAIIVRGAGAAGADLVTTILTFTNSGSVTLATNAGTTVTAAGALWEARLADTIASHTPWSESTPYSNATRPAFTPGAIAAGSVDNSASKASFTINASAFVYGGFLVDDNTKGGSSGTLYGMAPFTVASRQVLSGDTLNVTVTLAVTAT